MDGDRRPTHQRCATILRKAVFVDRSRSDLVADTRAGGSLIILDGDDGGGGDAPRRLSRKSL